MKKTRKTLIDALISEQVELEAKIECLTLWLQTEKDDEEERRLKMMQRYYMEHYHYYLIKRINKLGNV